MVFNLEKETIDGYEVSAETKKLWAVEMDLAKKLLEVCEKHNLKIWAAAGTLLGAVRHKGFIPWDDDMDFEMMRDDYNKLLEIGPKEFKDPYFFQSIYTDNIGGGLIKIRNSNTTMLQKGYDKYKIENLGCAIDVFVLDVVPDDKEEFVKEYNKVRRLRRIVNNYKLLKTSRLSGVSKLLNQINNLFFSVVNVNHFQKRIVNLLSKPSIQDNKFISAIDYSAVLGRNIEIIKQYPKEWYVDIIRLPFFEYTMPAPKYYHEVLTLLYGDYMKPVKGTASHSLIVVDCDRTYRDVIKELSKNTK